jgi:hypothetical protein
MRFIKRLLSFLPVLIVLAVCSAALGWQLTYGQEGTEEEPEDKPILVKNFRLGDSTLVCEADAIVRYSNGDPLEVAAVRFAAEDDLSVANLNAATDEEGYSDEELDGNIVFIESSPGRFIPGWRNCLEQQPGDEVHGGVAP